MRIGNHRPGTRSVAVVLAGVLLAALSVIAATTMTAQASGMAMTAGHDRIGNTRGWLHGRTVQLHYTKNFFCRQPPSSQADSQCELGDNFTRQPSNDFDPLFVIVPIGFTPKRSTLQCPTAGRCIDHPHTIDLSRVFGSGTGNALLPPHSHIVTTAARGKAEWWDVKVVGVKSQRVWNRIVQHKSYRTIRNLRREGNANITPNVPTNLFLFFSVRR